MKLLKFSNFEERGIEEMKKRILGLLLVVSMLFALTACSHDTPPAQDDAEQTPPVQTGDTTPEEDPQGWTGDTSHIIVTYNTLGTTPADLEKIQTAVNERTIPEIGVEVEFRATSAYDAFALYPTWIATGEQIDLMMPLLQDLRTYVDQGLIEPLDDLLAATAP